VTVSDKDRAALLEFVVACTSMVEALDVVEERAKLFAAANPVGFYVWTGGALPNYLGMLNEQRVKLQKMTVMVHQRLGEGDGGSVPGESGPAASP
jgi:hypothetical protein